MDYVEQGQGHTSESPGSPAQVMRYFACHGQETPRVNIQSDKSKAKTYQVRQVLAAIEKLEGMRHER
jgi:hypothetical protein